MHGMSSKILILLSACLLLSILSSTAQNKRTAYVDPNGVLRWNKTREEVRGFGVNYTLPFAYAYRNAVKKGWNPEQLIDEDVYHFARLGFDLFRVHVWDCEISDTLGNLLKNEHLRLFDYLVRQLKDRNIQLIITPIAFWGNGWPEPDEATPGFSTRYGKDSCLTNPAAIRAQQNYLSQFLQHVNPYTGLAYKDDDAVIAFEISNEPHHREPLATVRNFINSMVATMRKTGCKKPILYNTSHSLQSADAYFSSASQGGTFQWYPTGLGARHELGGNLLPLVDRYPLPYLQHPGFRKQAKIVYEFDAADVGRSYIYPAMVRSFRTAGLQLATHFAYDPTYSAYANTEYGTHYMNLLYTPQKALALKICGEVFRNLPLYKQYGSYPADTLFGPFRVSYAEDLAEMVSADKFFYTNHTGTRPAQPEQLREIAGWGHSPLVQYDGTGAYFLDKLADGVWRLELLPDAISLRDPFGRTSLEQVVTALHRKTRSIQVSLPCLGPTFSIAAISRDGFRPLAVAQEGKTKLTPGVYLLTRELGLQLPDPGKQLQAFRLFETAHFPVDLKGVAVRHEAPSGATAGADLRLEATVAGEEDPEQVEVYLRTPGAWFRSVPMERMHGFRYRVLLPAKELQEGYLEYYLVVKAGGKQWTYPGGSRQHPSQWDYTGEKPYRVPVLTPEAPVYLFEAATDSDQLLREWRRGIRLVPREEPGLEVELETLEWKDPENPAAVQPLDYSMRYFFGRKTAGQQAGLQEKSTLVIRAQSGTGRELPLQLSLVNREGAAFGAIVRLNPGQQEYRIPLNLLRRVPLVLLPRPYPTFLPYYFESGSVAPFRLEEAESVQFSVGPALPESEARQPVRFRLVWVRLE